MDNSNKFSNTLALSIAVSIGIGLGNMIMLRLGFFDWYEENHLFAQNFEHTCALISTLSMLAAFMVV